MGRAMRWTLLAGRLLAAWGAQQLEREGGDGGAKLRARTFETLEELQSGRNVKVEGPLPATADDLKSGDYEKAFDKCLTAYHKGELTELGRDLGSGMMGRVALEGNDAQKAWKFQVVTNGLARFATEVSAQLIAASLSFAPRVYDYFVCNAEHTSRYGTPDTRSVGFIAMERVDGVTFAEALLSRPRSTPSADVFCQPITNMGAEHHVAPQGFISMEMLKYMKDALSQLDGFGLITEDMTDTNIMVDKSGTPRFIDFGKPRKVAHLPGQAVENVLGGTLRCWTRNDGGLWPEGYTGSWPWVGGREPSWRTKPYQPVAHTSHADSPQVSARLWKIREQLEPYVKKNPSEDAMSPEFSTPQKGTVYGTPKKSGEGSIVYDTPPKLSALNGVSMSEKKPNRFARKSTFATPRKDNRKQAVSSGKKLAASREFPTPQNTPQKSNHFVYDTPPRRPPEEPVERNLFFDDF